VNTIALHPAAAPTRPSADKPSAREEPRLAESVYRTVSALRADPRWADEALPPDAYLAAVDSVATPHAAERRLDEFSHRIEPSGPKDPQA